MFSNLSNSVGGFGKMITLHVWLVSSLKEAHFAMPTTQVYLVSNKNSGLKRESIVQSGNALETDKEESLCRESGVSVSPP